MKTVRSQTILAATFIVTAVFTVTFARAADPLPSWNDGAAKKSIIDFVEKVTNEGSPDSVPVQERIATFDNDGTLWCEKPLPVQLYFVLDRVKALAPQHPEWKTKEPFASILKGDLKTAAAMPISIVGGRLLARDESVRKFGIVIAVGGLLAVAAILVSPQFFHVTLFESRTIQSGILLMSIYFLAAAQLFISWKKMATAIWIPKVTAIMMKLANSPWLSGFTFLSSMMMVSATWGILYGLTHSVVAALTLVGVQLLVVGWCYAQYRKTLAANPRPPLA
jgi:hypothetical protein